ncbi:hypothetical protein DNTS_026664 [Danionella cerebrum]|uniref:Ribonuclease A-domain domain-containing protein n=1 Tax=Danionella cerebrum TaxID=2873325 RepID=A0A553P8V0_9TELE|nr:hypothetical protein DNTS_026664 [Danionella translucida]
MELHLPAVVLVLVLAASIDCASYTEFLNRHVKPGMAASECNKVMTDRKINSFLSCKPINTFIKAEGSVVAEVCDAKGTHLADNLYKSVDEFDVIDCVKKKWSISCEYTGEAKKLRVIVICDDKKKPIHFERVEA